MSIFTQTAKSGGNGEGFEIPPAGSHPAVLVALVDLGTHDEEFTDEKTGAKKTKAMRKVYLCWELTGAKLSGSTMNHVVGRQYTLSLGKSAALRKMVEGYYGKPIPDGTPFDFTKLLGRPFLVSVVHKPNATGEKTYANFAGAGPVPQGLAVPKGQRKPFSREVTATDPLPDWLPYVYGEKLADIIARSHEVKGKPKAAPQPEAQPIAAGVVEDQGGALDGEDEIPF